MIDELTPIEETVAGRELIEIGMERGMGQLLIDMISEKFGQVSVEARQGVEALPMKDLPDLGRVLFHFPDAAALESWLRIRPAT